MNLTEAEIINEAPLVDEEHLEQEKIEALLSTLEEKRNAIKKSFKSIEQIKAKAKDESTLQEEGVILRDIMIDSIAKAKALSDTSFEIANSSKNPLMVEFAMNTMKGVSDLIKALSVLHKDISIERSRAISMKSSKVKLEQDKLRLEEMRRIVEEAKQNSSSPKQLVAKDKNGNEVSFDE